MSERPVAGEAGPPARPDPVQAKLAELVAVVESAKAVPLSASVLVNREEVLGLLEEVSALLPEAMRQARSVLQDKGAVLEQGRAEAAVIVDEAHQERLRMISDTEVYRYANAEAQRLLDEAHDREAALRAEVEDYVDGKLANFEIVLAKTLAAVERGRAKLAGENELDALADEDGRDDPLPG